MGYSYEAATGLLCCDSCGHAGGVRRVKCPAGWCQAVALCESCRKDPAVKARVAESHAGCAEASARFAANEWAVEAVKATGAYTFCASVYADSTRETVRCWFRNAAGDEKEAVVSNAVRDTLTRTSTYDDAMERGYTGVFVDGVKVAESRRVEM